MQFKSQTTFTEVVDRMETVTIVLLSISYRNVRQDYQWNPLILMWIKKNEVPVVNLIVAIFRIGENFTVLKRQRT